MAQRQSKVVKVPMSSLNFSPLASCMLKYLMNCEPARAFKLRFLWLMNFSVASVYPNIKKQCLYVLPIRMTSILVEVKFMRSI